jgi:hypothetical protein
MAMCVLGLFILMLIKAAMIKDPDQYRDISLLAAWWLDHFSLWIIACLPPVGMGFALCIMRPSPRVTWFTIIFATLWLAALMAMIVLCFLALLSPLYQYQPL